MALASDSGISLQWRLQPQYNLGPRIWFRYKCSGGYNLNTVQITMALTSDSGTNQWRQQPQYSTNNHGPCIGFRYKISGGSNLNKTTAHASDSGKRAVEATTFFVYLTANIRGMFLYLSGCTNIVNFIIRRQNISTITLASTLTSDLGIRAMEVTTSK